MTRQDETSRTWDARWYLTQAATKPHGRRAAAEARCCPARPPSPPTLRSHASPRPRSSPSDRPDRRRQSAGPEHSCGIGGLPPRGVRPAPRLRRLRETSRRRSPSAGVPAPRPRSSERPTRYTQRKGVTLDGSLQSWVPPPNGSRLSCGRLARRRKGVGRSPCPARGTTLRFPLERLAPASFKRLLGGQLPCWH